jgi:microtubule-associated protein 1 light chain
MSSGGVQSTYKNQTTFDKRERLASKIKKQHPTRVPVVIEISPQVQTKYLAPCDITFGKFMTEIRQHSKTEAGSAVYCFTENGSIPVSSATVAEVYQSNRDEDGFLYLFMRKESTFG